MVPNSNILLLRGATDSIYTLVAVAVIVIALLTAWSALGEAPPPGNSTAPAKTIKPATVRVAAVQAKRRLIDWHLKDPKKVLAAVDKNLARY